MYMWNLTNQNRLINKVETDARMCGTDRQLSGEGRGTGWQKVKGLAREHARRTHGHGQRCGDGQREGAGGWMEGDQGGVQWGHCNSVNNKFFLKRMKNKVSMQAMFRSQTEECSHRADVRNRKGSQDEGKV